MLASTKRRLGIVLAAALGVIAAGPLAGVANAQTTTDSSLRLAPTPVLSINLSPQGFVVPGPNPRPAGLVTYHVTTQDPSGHYWATFSLKNGVTFEQVAQWFVEGELPDLSVSIPALHNLYTNVDFTGGVAVYPTSPVDLTVNIKPNTTVYITDTLLPSWGGGGAAASTAGPASAATKLPSAVRAIGAAASKVASAKVSAADETTPSQFGIIFSTGTTNITRPPAFSAVLEAVEVNGQARLVPVGNFKGHGAFLFRNDATMPQEANFEKVDPGTTDADVQAFYDSILSGRGGVPYPFRGEPGGELLLSKGNMVIVGTNFAPGTYCALSFPTDWNTGIKQAFEGVHKVLTLR
jgi:hypothetical protein